jgi:hypothetical protein
MLCKQVKAAATLRHDMLAESWRRFMSLAGLACSREPHLAPLYRRLGASYGPGDAAVNDAHATSSS